MNLVPKNINEAIKHLSPRSNEDIQNAEKDEFMKYIDKFAKSFDRTIFYEIIDISEIMNLENNEKLIKSEIMKVIKHLVDKNFKRIKTGE